MSKYYVLVDGQEIGIQILHTESGNVVLLSDEPDAKLSIDFAALNSDVSSGAGTYSLIANGRSYQVHVEPTEEGLRMVMGGHRRTIEVLSEREWRLHKIAPRQTGKGGQATVKAPMPGLVKAVNVAEGDDVTRGQRLVVLEAMKMENEITAPTEGKVTKVHVTAGSTVDGGKPLITIG